jgi:SAM-dependent methyltransferase
MPDPQPTRETRPTARTARNPNPGAAGAEVCQAAAVTANSALNRQLTLERYPRSAGHDPQWMVANAMGPNPVWLTEWLCQDLPLQPGMRVLDLGCGRALTSIFLAREYEVTVTAADLWIKPTENWGRIVDADLADRVMPVYAEAHALPFAHGYFDAIVSVDATTTSAPTTCTSATSPSSCAPAGNWASRCRRCALS